MWPWCKSKSTEEKSDVNPWQEFVNEMYSRGKFPETKEVGRFPDKQQKELAYALIDEEVNKELLANFKKVRTLKMTDKQLARFLDDVVDSLWVIIWAARVVGVKDISPFFDEVGKANNAKIPESGPIKHPKTGKLQKPAGWKAPDMLGLVKSLLRKPRK